MAAGAVVSRPQDLACFRLAQNLAVAVHTMALRHPHAEHRAPALAMRRVACLAAESIVAATDRPLHRGAVVRSLGMAHAACDEARVHLDLLRVTGALADSEYTRLQDGYRRLGTMLTVLISAAQVRGQAALWTALPGWGGPGAEGDGAGVADS